MDEVNRRGAIKLASAGGMLAMMGAAIGNSAAQDRPGDTEEKEASAAPAESRKVKSIALPKGVNKSKVVGYRIWWGIYKNTKYLAIVLEGGAEFFTSMSAEDLHSVVDLLKRTKQDVYYDIDEDWLFFGDKIYEPIGQG